ncbi:MAG TPA: hypothetical protein VFA38_08695 [Nitrospirales bacterium]|nr:hypothetical protein [Nitrospirales bacterium]
MTRTFVLAMALCAFVTVTARADDAPKPDGGTDEAIEVVGLGTINWTAGLVTAVGSGAPPLNAVGTTQARAMAVRAAFAEATRNLLETVKDIRVDSATLVENHLVKSDVVKTRVTGLVKGAQILKTDMHPDGSVEITVGLSLRGELTDAMLPAAFGRRFAAAVSTAGPGVAPLVPPPPGVLIDARGLGVKPALMPRFMDEDGNELYPRQLVARANAVEDGVVGYTRDASAAARRSGNDPIVIKAVRTSGSQTSDLVLSQDAAKALQPGARVIVLFD